MDRAFGKNDRVFLGTLFLIFLVACASFYFFSGEKGAVAKVTISGQLYGTYSLKKDQEIEIVAGETVTNVLRIRNGKADMIAANCPDLLCVHQKAILRQRETIVCLPNKVVVEIIEGEEPEVDAVT